MNESGLLGYQKEPTRHLLACSKQYGSSIDASEMGLGKTYMGVALARELGLSTLVVCPKNSRLKWETVAEKMGDGVTAINYEKLGTGRTPYGEWWNDRGHKRFRFSPGIGFIIFDEVHRCGGRSTANAKMLIAAKQQGIRLHLISATLAEHPGRMKAIAYALGLYKSGTVQEMVRVNGRVVRREVPSRGTSDAFMTWAAKYNFYIGWKGLDFYGDSSDIAKLHRELFPSRGIRLRTEDLGDLFPETQIMVESIEMWDGRELERTAEMLEHALDKLQETREGDTEDMPATEATRELQEVELRKVPALMGKIEEQITAGRSVVTFVNYRATAELIQRYCVQAQPSIPAGLLIGGQSQAERELHHSGFQEDRLRVLSCTSPAGGETLDMHDVRGQYPRTSLIFPPYSAWLFKQVIGRVRRAGGKSKSLQYVLGAAGTRDDRVLEILGRKLDNLDTLLDGDLI